MALWLFIVMVCSMIFQGIFMIFHFLSFVSVQVSFVIVQVYLSLYYQARPRVQKVPPESHRWRCERFQTAWHVNGFGLLETWILALAWMKIPGPPAYLHQTGTLPMANVFSFWRTQAGRISTRYWRLPVVNNLSLLSFEVAWLSLLRAKTFPQCRRERVPFKGTHDILQSIWYGGRCHDSLEEGQYWSCIKIFRAALNARHFRRLFASSLLLVRSTMRWRKGWNR